MSDARQWISEFLWDRNHPLCVDVDADFTIRDIEGEAKHYGIELETGQDLRDALPVLHGQELHGATELEMMELPNGAVADIRLLPGENGARLLLTDAFSRRVALQQRQQRQHDVELLKSALEKSNHQLQDALTEAERANESKSRFIAGMSHEFRTPLTSIQGYAERLSGTIPESREVDAIRQSTRYLVSLVDNLLEQGRANAGELLIQPQPFEPARLGKELQDMFEPLAERRGLDLRIAVATDLPEWVEVDDTRLRQIAVNLLGNACKFTDMGHVGLSMRWAAGRLILEVDDSGPGIADADMDRVFGAFERVSHNAPGAGLGLAISRELARRMGGDLTLSSEAGQGSRFTLSVQAPRCAPLNFQAPDDKLDILLAEDSKALSMLFCTILREAGHTVELAENGNDAVTAARRGSPDCLVTDLSLPGLSGLDLIRSVRQFGYKGRIVTLTGSTAAKDREAALNAGADYFMTKPIDLERLLKLVHKP